MTSIKITDKVNTDISTINKICLTPNLRELPGGPPLPGVPLGGPPPGLPSGGPVGGLPSGGPLPAAKPWPCSELTGGDGDGDGEGDTSVKFLTSCFFAAGSN